MAGEPLLNYDESHNTSVDNIWADGHRSLYQPTNATAEMVSGEVKRDVSMVQNFTGQYNMDSIDTASVWNVTTLSFADWGNSDTAGNFSSNSSSNVLLEDVFLPGAILSGIFLALVIIMTIIGNILVLVAVAVNPHLRGTTHYFIANLAVADLLLGTTVLPFSASLEIVNYWAFGHDFCNIWAAMDVLCCTASIMNLCVISIDRYIGVTRPLQHSRIMSEKRAFYIIILVWILSLCISVAPYFGWKEPPPEDPRVCEITKQLGYVLFSVSGSFYIPLAIILIVYFRVYREALSQSRFLSTGVKHSKNGDTQSAVTLRIHTGGGSRSPSVKNPAYRSPSETSDGGTNCHRRGHGYPKLTMAGKIAKFKREKKAAKTLGIVVGVFILCWFPFFFCLPLEALCLTCSIPTWLFKIIFWLGYCNSMMNPIIYACSSREFKRAFIRILRCRFRRNSRSPMGSSVLFRSPSHKTTDITRLAKINHTFCFLRRGRKDKQKKCGNKRQHDTGSTSSLAQARDGSLQGLLWHGQQTDSPRNPGEASPIASLKHFHDKQRLGIDESIVISEDESAIHELTDEDEDDDNVRSKVVAMTPSTSIVPQKKNPPSCQTQTKLTPPIIQINGPDCGQLAHTSLSLDLKQSSIQPDRKFSLPIPLEALSHSKRKQYHVAKDTISKSQTHCNGVATKSRAANVESAKWNKYKERRNGSETSAKMKIVNNAEITPGESDIYEVADERIMWL